MHSQIQITLPHSFYILQLINQYIRVYFTTIKWNPIFANQQLTLTIKQLHHRPSKYNQLMVLLFKQLKFKHHDCIFICLHIIVLMVLIKYHVNSHMIIVLSKCILYHFHFLHLTSFVKYPILQSTVFVVLRNMRYEIDIHIKPILRIIHIPFPLTAFILVVKYLLQPLLYFFFLLSIELVLLWFSQPIDLLFTYYFFILMYFDIKFIQILLTSFILYFILHCIIIIDLLIHLISIMFQNHQLILFLSLVHFFLLVLQLVVSISIQTRV